MINKNSTKDEVLEAVKNRDLSLEYASKELRNDLDFLTLIVDNLGLKILETNDLEDFYESLKLKKEINFKQIKLIR